MRPIQKALLIWVVLMFAVGLCVSGFGCGKSGNEATLTVSSPAKDASSTPVEKKILYYRNPMDPTITSQTPMKDSMGMDYVPIYEGEAPAVSPAPGAPQEAK
jgi:membrane fusion protein, copper/silver efflux system